MLFYKKKSVHLQPENDSVAQSVEQLTLNQWAEGSSPSGVTACTETCRVSRRSFSHVRIFCRSRRGHFFTCVVIRLVKKMRKNRIGKEKYGWKNKKKGKSLFFTKKLRTL